MKPMILYVRGHGRGLYLTAWDGLNRRYVGGETYFVAGRDELVTLPPGPTHFTTREQAIAAAETMGFTVLPTPRR